MPASPRASRTSSSLNGLMIASTFFISRCRTTPHRGGQQLAAADKSRAVSAALSVRGLTKGYGLGEARIEVLRGVDLDISPGEMCAVMGPSGVGKSTLLSC